MDLIETFLEPELQLLKEKSEKLSKDERRRSLKIIQSLANGFLYFLPPIDAEPADSSFVPLTAKSNSRYPIYYREIHSHLHEQRVAVTLRARLLQEIDTVLDRLVSELSDDIESITTALSVSEERLGDADLHCCLDLCVCRRTRCFLRGLCQRNDSRFNRRGESSGKSRQWQTRSSALFDDQKDRTAIQRQI